MPTIAAMQAWLDAVQAATSLIAMSIFCNKSSPSGATRPRPSPRKCAARLANMAASASCADVDMVGAELGGLFDGAGGRGTRDRLSQYFRTIGLADGGGSGAFEV